MITTIFDSFSQNMRILYSFNIKYKNQSIFMKFLGILLFFNKEFMSKYITTIGNTIYFPNEEFVQNNPEPAICILAHELMHIRQAEKYGKIIFSILYLFPQCLALLALLAPVSLWFLVFLICLAPLPAPWRTKFEREGYTMSLFMFYEQLKINQTTPDKIRASLLEHSQKINNLYFKGSAYWFMWPFGIIFENNIIDIMNGVIESNDAMYKCVRQAYLNALSNTHEY